MRVFVATLDVHQRPLVLDSDDTIPRHRKSIETLRHGGAGDEPARLLQKSFLCSTWEIQFECWSVQRTLARPLLERWRPWALSFKRLVDAAIET